MKNMKWMKKPKPELHIVSLSGGKDSTAMLLRMIEEQMPIDIILFCDTGLEFPAMYRHLDKLQQDIGRPITRICSNHTFEHYLLQHEVRVKRTKEEHKDKKCRGYSWPGPKQRWCTKEFKDIPREQFLRPLREKYDIIEYVGLAADEEYRLERKNNQRDNCRHPLVDWGMTEKDCIEYCYARGYTWEGLYDYYDRVSCWCCPLQPLSELRILYERFPELWAQLKEWDRKSWRNFKPGASVEQLEQRFEFENAWVQSGKALGKKDFYTALKAHLNTETEE